MQLFIKLLLRRLNMARGVRDIFAPDMEANQAVRMNEETPKVIFVQGRNTEGDLSAGKKHRRCLCALSCKEETPSEFPREVRREISDGSLLINRAAIFEQLRPRFFYECHEMPVSFAFSPDCFKQSLNAFAAVHLPDHLNLAAHAVTVRI